MVMRLLTRYQLQALLAVMFLCLLPSTAAQEQEGDGRGQEAMVVYVDTESGRDESCLPLHAGTTCASLEAVASGIDIAYMENLTSFEIVIRSPRLKLKKPLKFENLSLVKIIGAPTQIQCVANGSAEINGNSSAGMVFVSIQNLFMENIVLEHCGTFSNDEYTVHHKWVHMDNQTVRIETYNGTEREPAFRAAIHILNSTNVQVRSIAVLYSNGAGMAVNERVHGGTLNVSDSRFHLNVVPVKYVDLYAGGGGAVVLISDASHNNVEFKNCTFSNNNASTVNFYKPTIFGDVISGRGKGGGLLVSLVGDATRNEVKIANCNFTHNSAAMGGGLHLFMQQHTRENSVTIANSFFVENGCQSGLESLSGGGLFIGYNNDGSREHVLGSLIYVKDSVFTRNCAEIGGGTAFHTSHSIGQDDNHIWFENCNWTENSGHIGSAVDISPNPDHRLQIGYLPRPVFSDCRFINNSAIMTRLGKQQASAKGTLFSSLVDIRFNSSAEFKHNTDSALVVVDAVADFSSSSAVFADNTGDQGGAISLVGASSMIIGPHVYHFVQNRAADKGGAISSNLVDEHDIVASRSCFIQYGSNRVSSQWDSILNFTGNDAPIGRSIFTTAIIPCLLYFYSITPNATLNLSVETDPQNVFRPDIFFFDDPIENQLATDGARFEPVGEGPIQVIPGEEHLLQVNIVDDFGQLVDTTLRAEIYNYDQEKSDVELDTAFSYVEDKRIKLRGEVGKNGTLLLQFIGPRESSILLDFVLVPCPVGYSLNEKKECECDVNSYQGLTNCNPSNLTAYIREGSWAGYVKGSLMTAICPMTFCHFNNADKSADILLPRTSSNTELDAFICGPSRTGVLCGDCAEGHSAYYHSPYFSCRENNLCSFGWLFYILSGLVPATIFFVLVLLFNIRFTSGKLNGFIFFCQFLTTLFIETTDIIKVPKAVYFLSWGYQIVYQFFSLDFFTIEPLSFCLWEGATVLDVLAFKYVTIAYSLILVILVILFMKYSARRLLGNYVKISTVQNSVIHGLSAFLVVCYMQCIRVSLMILLSARSLKGKDGTLLSPDRVWFSGEVEVFSPRHLPYAIPALLCLLTLGAVPPILLLAYPLNNKIASLFKITEESPAKAIFLINKLKPMLDSFQGCFKDDLRFFASLYFIYRWVGLLVYAASPDFSTFYTVLQVFLIVILMIHALVQPYEKQWDNRLDVLLLANLALINLCTSFNYYIHDTHVVTEEGGNPQAVDIISSFQLILIYLPILVMCAYLVVTGIKKFSKKENNDDIELAESGELYEREFPLEDARESQEEESLLHSGPSLTYGVA